ncbi:DUF1349 domain-containing protein [Brucella pseudogrignonensis]|uniref:DUF1349 domain-containing protein n=1 Tax=Brucella pseudogrignonensis TaxID=419475 RepID=UPI003D967C22
MKVTISNQTREFTPSDGSDWKVDDDAGSIGVRAHGHSDIFIDPGKSGEGVTTPSRHNAALLMTSPVKGDFQFTATVNVDFASTFDAGVLFLRINEKHWAKLCFEFSPDRKPMVVSVVNKGGTSDDANAFNVDGNEVKLRISRKDGVYAFHGAVDGDPWTFTRAFAFEIDEENLEVGFEAQSPYGDGCDVTFSNYSLTDESLGDFRNGS